MMLLQQVSCARVFLVDIAEQNYLYCKGLRLYSQSKADANESDAVAHWAEANIVNSIPSGEKFKSCVMKIEPE